MVLDYWDIDCYALDTNRDHSVVFETASKNCISDSFVDHDGYSPVAQLVKNPPAMWETWIRSLGWEDPPGEGKGYPLLYSCLETSMDRGAWWATVHGVAESWTSLSD